jgi:hypothetical protein
LNDEPLEEESQDEEYRNADDDGEIWIDPPQLEEPETGVHPHHEELTVGKVNDPHDTKDEGHPHRDQGIEPPDQNTGHDRLDKYR